MKSSNSSRRGIFRGLVAHLPIKLLLLFAALCIGSLSVIAILIATGQRPTSTGLISTGNIRVNIEPLDAQAFLNDKAVTVTDKLITGLTPGTYRLKFTRSEYSSWEGEVKVSGGLVTEVAVRLLPQQLQLTQVTRTNINRATFSQDGGFIYYVVSQFGNEAQLGLWRQRSADTTPLNIFAGSESVQLTGLTGVVGQALEAGNYELIPSPDNRKLIIKVGKTYYLLAADTLNSNAQIVELNSKLTLPIDRLQWLRGSDKVLIESGSILVDYDLNSSVTTVADYATAGLVYTVSNGLVYKYKSTATGPNQIMVYENGVSTPLALPSAQLRGKIEKLYAASENTSVLVYKNDVDDLYYLDVRRDIQVQIGSKLDVVEVSANGGAIALSQTVDGKTTFSSFTVREILAVNRIETKLSVLSLPGSEWVKFSPASTNLLIYAGKQLYLADRDGTNPVKLGAQPLTLGNRAASVNSNNNKVFLLSGDVLASQTNAGDAATNIYFYSLNR